MRIDLESTLTVAEGMYLQVTTPEVVEKLPNKIRTILGYPEREEPLNDTIEIVDRENSNDAGSCISNSSQGQTQSSTNSVADNRSSRNGVEHDDYIEGQYDSGNQFL